MATLSKELEIFLQTAFWCRGPEEEAEELRTRFCDGSAGERKGLVVEPPVGQQEESQ